MPAALRGVTADPPPTVEDLTPTSWRPAEWMAVGAGWAVALLVLLPPALASHDGARAAAALMLAATLAFWAATVVVMRSDLRDFIIPDEASLGIAALGLAVAAGVPWLLGDGPSEVARSAGAAAAVGAGAFAVFWIIGASFRAAVRDALGFGDVKLAGACALWLSPADAALALELAALGAIATLLATRRDGSLRDTAVPFGAFLAPAVWLVLVLAPPLRDAGLLPW